MYFAGTKPGKLLGNKGRNKSKCGGTLCLLQKRIVLVLYLNIWGIGE
jgi:hypothetical protein